MHNQQWFQQYEINLLSLRFLLVVSCLNSFHCTVHLEFCPLECWSAHRAICPLPFSEPPKSVRREQIAVEITLRHSSQCLENYSLYFINDAEDFIVMFPSQVTNYCKIIEKVARGPQCACAETATIEYLWLAKFNYLARKS